MSETWLNDSYSTSEVGFSNYEVYRRSRGGGVLIAVSSALRSRMIQVGSCSSSTPFDNVFVFLQIRDVGILLGCVYIPPDSGPQVYVDHCHIVEELCSGFPDAQLFLAGDYNLRDARWGVDLVDGDTFMTVDCHHLSSAVHVCESFNSLSLYQSNSVHNDHSVFLDLLFTSRDDIVTTSCDDPLLSNSFHHTAFSFFIPVPCKTEKLSQNRRIYDFAKCNYVELKTFLSNVDWSFILSESAIDTATEHFYNILLEGISFSTPLKRIYRSSYPVWFSNELKALTIDKKKAHLEYKRHGLPSDYIKFSLLRSRCNYLGTKCYREFMQKSDESLKSNPRSFWKFVNMTRKIDGFPKDMFLLSEMSNSGHQTVNLFAKSFSAAYASSDISVPEYVKLDCIDFNSCCFTSSDVYKALTSLPLKYSSGPDGVPSFILKKCAASLAIPLSMLFNRSLSSGVFPLKWKSSFVFPIFKSGDRSNVANYRGVCVQSAIPKLLDQLITSQLSFACKHFIAEEQHGFFAKRSTVTNLLSYQQDIVSSFQSGKEVHSIYTDVAKAFDRVNPRFLVAKLRSYGIGDSFLRWLENSLEGRTQIVKIGDVVSESIDVLSGVGQGSHSGPLLFSLFFNDLPHIIRKSSFLMFADDVKIYKSISSSEDCLSLQRDLNAFYQWLVLNGLQLTLSKCAVMVFFRNRERIQFPYLLDNQPLQQVDQIKDLGIIIDRKITFSSHISNLSMRCHRLLGYIFRSSKGLSASSFRILYLSLVRSLLEYGAVVWSPQYNVHSHLLDRVQKRFLFYHRLRYPDCTVDLDSLSKRRQHADLTFLRKLLSGLVDCDRLSSSVFLDCHRRLRRNNLFYVATCATNYTYSLPLNRMLRAANSDSSFDFS